MELLLLPELRLLIKGQGAGRHRSFAGLEPNRRYFRLTALPFMLAIFHRCANRVGGRAR